MFTVTRNEHNPILSPSDHAWEKLATFNGCPIKHGDEIVMLYRAMGLPDPYEHNHTSLSIIGKAVSNDGINFKERIPFITPSEDFDAYGCEDPRVTKLDDTYYIFYTALGSFPYNADHIRTALAISKDLKTIESKHLVTPFNSKAMMLFPEKINGKFAALISVNPDLKPIRAGLAFFDKEEDIWSKEYWDVWYKDLDKHAFKLERRDKDHIELGAPPLKTDKGWLLIYSHIQRYDTPEHVFGIEAVLLDLEDPKKVIAQTRGPFLVPEMYYEKIGIVQNITFPTGALINGNDLHVYYGGADTHIATARIPLNRLFDAMFGKKLFVRPEGNPILAPRPNTPWEKGGVLNPATLLVGDVTYMLYRAATEKNVSTIGFAKMKDGEIIQRNDSPIYLPRADFEKRNEDNNYGCEDPRLIQIEDTVYMFYTAYNGAHPRVAVSSISYEDFKDEKWEAWTAPQAITHPDVDDKDAILIPEKTHNGYCVIHRAGVSICADHLSSLDFKNEQIDKCIELIDPRYGMWDGIKVGASTPAIKTEFGWLLIYHGISWNHIYRVGALLLDLKDPTIILARSAFPIFEPEEYYEKKGTVGNVVFPCGTTLVGDTLTLFYGAADTTIGMARCSLEELLTTLTS